MSAKTEAATAVAPDGRIEQRRAKRALKKHAPAAVLDAVAAAEAPTATPIWEVVTAIMAQVPDETLAELPRDGATQHDHYLYGTLKR